MTAATLYRKFNEALAWNGALYFLSTASKFAVSLMLYRTLPLTDFAVWANILSIVFLTSLWLDFGLSRSLPQYAQAFSKCPHAKRQFLRNILLFKGVAAILVAGIAAYLAPSLHVYLGAGMLCIESMKATVRLIYHSYLRHKMFNQVESGVILTRLLAIAALCAWHISLPALFTVEIVTSLALTVYSFLRLGDAVHGVWQESSEELPAGLGRSFAKHSGVIWAINTTSSISERNFLVPFFTYLFGPEGGALFKVANDGALLFSRFVLKTIGTAGTSLLSHATSRAQLKLLNNRIANLTLPLIGVVLCSAVAFAVMPWTNNLLFSTFFILALGYLTQLLYMGYDRVLEVTHSYQQLLVSLIPYCMIMGLFALAWQSGQQISLASLPLGILAIQLLRLSSTFMRLRSARALQLQ